MTPKDAATADRRPAAPVWEVVLDPTAPPVRAEDLDRAVADLLLALPPRPPERQVPPTADGPPGSDALAGSEPGTADPAAGASVSYGTDAPPEGRPLPENRG
jgi:hypothetical protein